ncbi:TUP1-like enhancer of split-domain-containing protein [Spinellus fusiger]|nr:TUP1-like enhancer of split-domain-containing protein [Spinellus fusiger]
MEDSIYKQGQSASSLENRVEYTTSSIYVPQGGLSASINHTKTTAQSNTTAMSNGSTSESTVLRERPAWVDSASVPSSVLESKIRLPVPVLKSKCIYKHDTNHQSIVMESHNNTHHGDHKELAKIVVSCQGSVLWTDYLASPVLLMTGNQNYSVAACENATLHVYSLSGRRLIPPIVLESTPVILHSYEQWLLCLTMTGLLYVWDIVNKKKHIHSISIAPILGIAHSSSNSSSQSTPSIKDARIRKNGLPIFTTSNQQAFTYDLTMGVWICISDAWYSVSDLWHAGSRTTQLHPDQHPLGWLFTAVTSMNTPSYSLGSEPLSSDVNDSITLSHLEIQLAVSVLLDSPEEYKNCLLLYAKRLARTGAQKKVEDLLGWLAGPPFIPVNETWTPNVLDNLLKKDLLKHILPILSSNRQLQRITNEYRQLV